MRAKITLAIGLWIGASSLGLWACSNGDSKDGGMGTDGTTDMDTGVADTGLDTGADTGKPDTGPDCTKADGGGNGCRACCQAEHPNGALFFQSAIHICVCANGSSLCPSCASNYCAPDAALPNQNCASCAYNSLNADGGACFSPVGNACAKDKECLAWFQCQAKCP